LVVKWLNHGDYDESDCPVPTRHEFHTYVTVEYGGIVEFTIVHRADGVFESKKVTFDFSTPDDEIDADPEWVWESYLK
ncbi:MAG: hypothetical protein ACO395_10095, partial [Pontimonas sp.]